MQAAICYHIFVNAARTTRQTAKFEIKENGKMSVINTFAAHNDLSVSCGAFAVSTALSSCSWDSCTLSSSSSLSSWGIWCLSIGSD